MLFEKFRETDEFVLADVITFIGTYGEEIDIGDPYSDDLNGFYVENWRSNGGYLEIVLN